MIRLGGVPTTANLRANNRYSISGFSVVDHAGTVPTFIRHYAVSVDLIDRPKDASPSSEVVPKQSHISC